MPLLLKLEQMAKKMSRIITKVKKVIKKEKIPSHKTYKPIKIIKGSKKLQRKE